MSLIMRRLSELYHYYNVEQADPETRNWFFVRNPLYIFSLLFGYAYFVLRFGPKFMEKRNPYSLKTFIFYYNIFQIVTNALIVHRVYTTWNAEYSIGCEPVRQIMDKQLVAAVQWTLALKILDLTETVIFVLRKKTKQISFLHMYHHITTVLLAYYCTKYYPGGMFWMLVLINGSVHVIMYTYYLLASLGSPMQSFTNTLKPYITRIQIVQFLFLLAHQSQAFLPSCTISKKPASLIVGNLILNLFLFLNFYRRNYKKSSKIA